MSTIDDVLSGAARWHVALSDCLEVMQALPESSVDAVVTDPPYCSGARTSAAVTARGSMQRGARWEGRPIDSDQMTATGFVWLMREVGRESLRVLKPGGFFVSFIDWRQYPMLYGALETTNLRVCQMLVWDKEAFGLGSTFRNQHELAIVASKGVANAHHHGTGNVLRGARISSSDLHPSEKPAGLFAQILPVVAPAGGLIVDPFVGSGASGIAAMDGGYRFIGVEREAEYHGIASARIAHAVEHPGRPWRRPDAAAAQSSLFAGGAA